MSLYHLESDNLYISPLLLLIGWVEIHLIVVISVLYLIGLFQAQTYLLLQLLVCIVVIT